MVKAFVRNLIPEPLVNVYHYVLARLAAVAYGNPSERLVVIGVTGTNGKSTTVNYIGRILEHAGSTVGWTSTAMFKVADREWANDKKMTMLGRFQTQKLLRDMVRAGCTHAVVETSSQGLAQHRHVGINYDMAVFTNLTPEHIEAHGGFENYKRAKGKLFEHVAQSKRKTMDKTAVVNIDDEHAEYFLSFPIQKKFGYGVVQPASPSTLLRSASDGQAGSGNKRPRQTFVPVVAKNVSVTAQCSTFTIDGTDVHLKPIGLFNVYNALAAIAVVRALGLGMGVIRDAVASLEFVPGRLETIDEGQPFTVIVDYAYEPAALSAVYDAIALLKKGRVIHVVGSAGGGRDVARRPVLGALAARHDDIVIVTNEDPYDEDPQLIIDAVADGAVSAGKKDNVDLFRVLDRQEAINKAITLAQPGDLVLITGKGSEPVMAVANGKKVPWDDCSAVRKALHENTYAR